MEALETTIQEMDVTLKQLIHGIGEKEVFSANASPDDRNDHNTSIITAVLSCTSPSHSIASKNSFLCYDTSSIVENDDYEIAAMKKQKKSKLSLFSILVIAMAL